MSKVLKYAIAYGMWIVNLGLSAWLIFISRTALLAFLAVLYEPGDFQFTKIVNLVDRIFTVVLGLGWLVLAIFTEENYRTGALKENLLKIFARYTGPLLLCIFIVDLMLFWLQGIAGDNWLRWLILTAELVIGLVLVLYGKKTATDTSK